MIKQAELIRTNDTIYRFSNESNMSLERARTAIIHFIEKANNQYNLPITILEDDVKSGGIFFGSTAPCIVIKNKEHPYDYYQLCLILNSKNGVVWLESWLYGSSTLAEKASRGKMNGLGGALKNAAFGTKDKREEEQNYYRLLKTLLAEASR